VPPRETSSALEINSDSQERTCAELLFSSVAWVEAISQVC